MSLFENKNSKDVLTAINANPARQIHSKSDWQLIGNFIKSFFSIYFF